MLNEVSPFQIPGFFRNGFGKYIFKGKTMANKNFRLGILAMVLGFLVTGCAYQVGRYTVISTNKIDWNRAQEYTRGDRVKGEDMYYVIILWSSKTSMISIENAVDNALKEIPGAVALVDAVVKCKEFYFPFIYVEFGFYIEGTVLVDPELALSGGDTTNYLVFYTEDGKEFQKTAISKAEYLSYVK
jgi:hypothetical protein